MQTQYQVPQFIDVEDKVVGPMTLRQFFIVAGGIGISVLLFIMLRLAFAIVLSVPIVTFAFALAFIKINGMPFWRYLMAAVGFAARPQEYFWRK